MTGSSIIWFETLVLPPDSKSARQARDFVCANLTSHDLLYLVDDIRLVVSELVTNALRYGEGDIRLRLLLDRTLVCEVWDAGLVHAAIEVEEMWNELGGQYPFSLLCAYPARPVTCSHYLDALTEVCRAHTEVTGSPPEPELARPSGS